MRFNEDSRVKIPAIVNLTRLSYTFLPKAEITSTHGDTNFAESRALELEIQKTIGGPGK